MSKTLGDRAEQLAQRWLEARGWRTVCRNYRWAQGPGRPGGEIDIVALDPGGTLVFVEVRMRASLAHGGAAASVSLAKRQRLARTAHHFLCAHPCWENHPCRFDLMLREGWRWQWLPGAWEDTDAT